MSEYEPRKRTPEWERLLEAHREAAELFITVGWAGCETRSREVWYAANDAQAAGLNLHVEPVIALYRDGVCVSQWAFE